MEVTPSLIAAMRNIGRVQAGLLGQGLSLGTFGPCGDGIDGRWGEVSRAAYGEYATATGLKVGSDALIQSLGITDISAMTFQNSINAWNQWRNQWIEAGLIDTADYHTAANAALASALPEVVEACIGAGVGGESPPVAVTPPVADLSRMNGNGAPPAATTNGDGESEGIPWWVFALIGVALVGGGIYAYIHYRGKGGRRARRSTKRAPALAAWGAPPIEDEELGDEGYNGYGEEQSEGGDYTPPEPEPDDSEEGG